MFHPWSVSWGPTWYRATKPEHHSYWAQALRNPCAHLESQTVQFSHLVISDSLRPHGLQHARPPCASPTPRACPNSYPLSQWCHPTFSSSVVPFSSCLQSFPASGSLLMSQLNQVAKGLEFQLQHQSFQCPYKVKRKEKQISRTQTGGL